MAKESLKEIKLTPIQGILGGLLVGAIIIIALHFLVREPMKLKENALVNQVGTARNELKINQALVGEAPGLQKKHAELAQKLFLLSEEQLVPEENPVRWGNTLVEKYAMDESIKVKSFNTSGIDGLGIAQKTDKGIIMIPTPYEEFRTDIALSGTYHQLGRFLASMESQLPGMRLHSLNLRPAGKQQKDGLYISLKVNYLRFSETGFPPALRPDLQQMRQENESKTSEEGK